MRAITLFAFFILGCAALVIAPTITTGQIPIQFQPGGGGGGGMNFQPGGFTMKRGDGGGMTIDAALNPDAVNQWADADFKRRDANNDGKLNKDEMPGPLKANLAKWDKNGDGFIDINE